MDKEKEERRPVMLSLRLSPAEAQALHSSARQAGRTVSDLCRRLLAPALGTAVELDPSAQGEVRT